MMKKSLFVPAALALAILVAGCSTGGAADPILPSPPVDAAPGGIARPEGWSAESHAKSAAPNYEVVFPETAVNRLDLAIAAHDWQAMLDDMTELLGPFGQRPSPPRDGAGPGDEPLQEGAQAGRPPLEAVTACENKGPGETCSFTFEGRAISGACIDAGGLLACAPPGGPPPGGPGNPPGLPVATSDRNPIFVACTLRFNGKTWYHVGVRFKGLSSLRMTWQQGLYKLPLRLDMDEFEDQHPEIHNQRLYGFKKLGLSNGFADPSLLREKVAGDLLREAGVPAARTAIYRVYLDHGEGPRYLGLYTMTEIPHDPMLERQFGESGGNLYKPDGPGADWTRFDERGFAKKSNEKEADYGDVQAAIAALHADRQDAAAWRSGLEAVFDVDGFLRWLAVNTLIENWDVYGNIAHNYYLYGCRSDGRLRWIPWDHNHALQGSERNLSLELSEVSDRFPLIRYLMDDPRYQQTYYDHLQAALDAIYAVAPLQARLQQAHAMVEPYVVGAEGEQPGYSLLSDPGAFHTALDDLMARVERRHHEALRVLDAHRH